ncbi:MAG TPA: A/G-specific adenine glycosylase [Streptosporangiaceae bacterium]
MTSELAAPILGWYGRHARDLPWRRPDASAWAVLVSEIMLQQTSVSRVLPAYRAFLQRWPAPADLAAATAADVLRQWGRLGYPRRALRLHAAAGLIVSRHGGVVPDQLTELLALPGVGGYTAAAVACFAYGQSHPVLDTNVRRVLARLVGGRQWPPRSTSAAEVALARQLLPAAELAPRWSVAVMELGALVCTAARPGCDACPVAGQCAWRCLGSPAAAAQPRQQRYEGSDRQCRGALLAALRDSAGPVRAGQLSQAWPEQEQLARALTALVADGLAVRLPRGSYGLPGGQPISADDGRPPVS